MMSDEQSESGGKAMPDPKVTGSAMARAAAKPDKREMLKFPLLVHAPLQWGPGVRTEDGGIPVEELAHDVLKRVKKSDDPEEHFEAMRAVAVDRGTTEEHVRQACEYVVTVVKKAEKPSE
jgi:hypothetical protein